MDPVQPAQPAAAPPTDTTAPTRIDASGALDAMSDRQRETWRETGKLPDSIAVGPADSEPKPVAAKVDEDAPAVDAKGQPVTGQDGKPLSKREQKRIEQQHQINENIRQRAEAERRADAAEKRAAELEARINGQQPKVDAKPTADAQADAEPTLDDFLDQPDPYLAYSRALAKWEVKQTLAARDAEAGSKAKETAAQESIHRVFTTYQERETSFKANVPDFDARTQGFREVLDLRFPLDQSIVTSEVAPQLILHLAEKPDEVRRIAQLASTNLPAALREIGRLEAQFITGAEPAPAEPQPKHVTSAPKPATTLGTRTADAVDPVEGAIRRKDAGAYIRERNARDLAAAGK